MRGLWSILLLAVVAGCGPQISSMTFVHHSPKPKNHPIKIFSTKTPECPYEELGRATSRRGLLAADWQVLGALEKRARVIGAMR